MSAFQSSIDLGTELTAHTLEGESYPAPIRRPRSNLPLIAAGVAVIVLGGGLGVWISQRGNAATRDREPIVATPEPLAPTPTPTPTATPPAPTPDTGAIPTSLPTPTPPPAPTMIALQIETIPAGAEVLVGDQVVCTTTPCSLEGAPGSERAIVLRKSGRRTETRVVRFDEARTESVALRPAPTGGRPPGPGPGPGPGLQDPDGPRPGGPSKSDLKAPQGWSDLLR
jgi:hypothetical protein